MGTGVAHTSLAAELPLPPAALDLPLLTAITRGLTRPRRTNRHKSTTAVAPPTGLLPPAVQRHIDTCFPCNPPHLGSSLASSSAITPSSGEFPVSLSFVRPRLRNTGGDLGLHHTPTHHTPSFILPRWPKPFLSYEPGDAAPETLDPRSFHGRQ